jgi:hypothetical protein
MRASFFCFPGPNSKPAAPTAVSRFARVMRLSAVVEGKASFAVGGGAEAAGFAFASAFFVRFAFAFAFFAGLRFAGFAGFAFAFFAF